MQDDTGTSQQDRKGAVKRCKQFRTIHSEVERYVQKDLKDFVLPEVSHPPLRTTVGRTGPTGQSRGTTWVSWRVTNTTCQRTPQSGHDPDSFPNIFAGNPGTPYWEISQKEKSAEIPNSAKHGRLTDARVSLSF